MGNFPLGSASSRAAARALANARQESEAEDDWDKPLDKSIAISEIFREARERELRGEVFEHDWSPIDIPPGKENTERGRLATRINEAGARMARLESERK